MWCMRSYLFMGVSRVPVREMALALLTRMSIPPNCLTAFSTAVPTLSSSRTSTIWGKACPPAASTKWIGKLIKAIKFVDYIIENFPLIYNEIEYRKLVVWPIGHKIIYLYLILQLYIPLKVHWIKCSDWNLPFHLQLKRTNVNAKLTFFSSSVYSSW